METEETIEGDLVEEQETALAELKPGPAQMTQAKQTTAAITPVNQMDRLIELAVSGNADMDKLERLFELKQRYEAEDQRRAFAAAMAAFKAEGLVIEKDRTVSFPHKDQDGKTEYRHASLGNVIGLASPLLAKHGIHNSWDRVRDEARIKVRAVLTHKDGHREVGDWWDGPPDDSGKKNPLQQGSSTTTYLERYSFLAITGLAVIDGDDDGDSAGDEPQPERISEEEQMIIHAMVTDNDLDMDTFLGWLKQVHKLDGIERIPVALYSTVTAKLKKAIKAKAEQA